MFMSLLSHALRYFLPSHCCLRPEIAQTFYVVLGSLSFSRATPLSKPFRIALYQNPIFKGGRCIGRSLVPSLPLNIWPSGWLAGKPFRISHFFQSELIIYRLPFYWELKTLFLLFLSLPQTQVGLRFSPQICLLTDILGLDVCLQHISPAVLRQEWSSIRCRHHIHPT